MATELWKIKRKYETVETTLAAALIAKQWGYAADTKRIAVMESDGVTVRYYWDASSLLAQTSLLGSALIGTIGITGVTPTGGSSGAAATVQAMLGGLANANTNYIFNQTSQQASSNFNISGAGVIGTTLTVTGTTTTAAISMSGSLTMSLAQARAEMTSTTASNPCFIEMYANGVKATISKAGTSGTDFMTSGTAGALQLVTATNLPVQIGVNGALVATFAAAGTSLVGTLAVTGALTLSNLSSGRIPVISTSGLIIQDNLYWDATNDFVGVGANSSTPESILHLTRDDTCNIINSRASTGDTGPGILLRKARGTHASPTLVQAGDMMGKILGQGCHIASAGNYADTAYITFMVGSGSFSSGERPPSEIRFYTNAANGSQTLALTITEAQAATFASSISVAGGLTLTSDFIYTTTAQLIRANTTNGSDTKSIHLCGGDSADVGRGGYVSVFGNEHASTGKIRIAAGDHASGTIILATGTDTARLTITQAGASTFSGSLTSTGDFAVGSNTLTVAASSGDLDTAGEIATDSGLFVNGTNATISASGAIDTVSTLAVGLRINVAGASDTAGYAVNVASLLIAVTGASSGQYRSYGVGVPGDTNTEYIQMYHNGASHALIGVTKSSAGTYRSLLLATSDTTRLTIAADGTVTIAQLLQTAASSTSRAGINLPSGTAPSSPVSGDLWYDGTNLKFRDGGTSRTITWT